MLTIFSFVSNSFIILLFLSHNFAGILSHPWQWSPDNSKKTEYLVPSFSAKERKVSNHSLTRWL